MDAETDDALSWSDTITVAAEPGATRQTIDIVALEYARDVNDLFNIFVSSSRLRSAESALRKAASISFGSIVTD
jgi:hypothetical protein